VLPAVLYQLCQQHLLASLEHEERLLWDPSACLGLLHQVCREFWGQPSVSQVLVLLGSLEVSQLVSLRNKLQASLVAAQQASLEEACWQESRAGNYGCHKMQVWQVVGRLACWAHLDTLLELQGVALLALLEPPWRASAQTVSLEVGPLAFLVVSNRGVLRPVVVLLECHMRHHSILRRMQQESWASLAVCPNGLESWACTCHQQPSSS